MTGTCFILPSRHSAPAETAESFPNTMDAPSILLLNIGNSHTQMAEYSNGRMGPVRQIATAELSPEMLPEDHPIAAASVVPQIRERLRNRSIFFLENRHAAAAGLRLDCVDASTLGADRLANAIELVQQRQLPAVTIDFGTAITLELVDENACFRGGAIAPGRMLMRRALHAGTAQLPELPIAAEIPRTVGIDTASSMRFGIDRGAIGMVREWLRTLNDGRALPCRVIAVGGDAPFFCAEVPELIPGGEDFTLRGVLAAYRAAV